MKKVLSSNGIFEITNSLYGDIKKNNPELLEFDDPSVNKFDIKRRYEKATGLKYNPNGSLFDALKEIIGKTDGDPEKFQAELKDIFEKSDKDEKKFKENLGNILNKKEIQDYRGQIKNFNTSSDDSDDREIFIDSIKSNIGEDNFNKLSYTELNNWFKEWNKKDEKGQAEFFNKIGDELNKKFNNNDDKNSIQKNIKSHSIIKGSYDKIKRIFKNSFNGKWDMDVRDFLTYVISMFNVKYNGDENKIEDELKKFYNENKDELKNYIDSKNKNGLIDLFNEIVQFCNMKEKYNNEEQKQESIDFDLKENRKKCYDYIKKYDSDESPRIENYIKPLLKDLGLSEEQIDKKLKFYFDIIHNFNASDHTQLSDEEFQERTKVYMKKIYDIAEDEYKKMKKYIEMIQNNEKNNVNENYHYKLKSKTIQINEDDNNNNNDINRNANVSDLLDIFTNDGFSSARNYVMNGSNIDDAINSDEIDNNETAKRYKLFLKYSITNGTIKYIVELYNQYVKNNNPINRKQTVLNDLYFKITDAIHRISNINREENKQKIKTINSIIFSLWILGENIAADRDLNYDNNNINEYYNKIIEQYKNIKDDNNIDPFNSNNLLKYLNEEEWDKFKQTLSPSDIFDNGDENNEEYKNKTKENMKENMKKSVDFIINYSFKTKVPGTIENFKNTIYKNLKGKIIRSSPFISFGKDFGSTSASNMFIRKFLIKSIKNFYKDILKNKSIEYKNMIHNVSLIDIFDIIPDRYFWNNVYVISCWTHNSYNLVLSTISQMNIRDELNVYRNIVTTGLPTSTIIYGLEDPKDKDKDSKNKLRNGNKLVINNSIEKEIYDKLNRFYFIVVTEGVIKKGQLAKNIVNAVGNAVNNKNNKFFGLDMSSNRYK